MGYQEQQRGEQSSSGGISRDKFYSPIIDEVVNGHVAGAEELMMGRDKVKVRVNRVREGWLFVK